MRLPRRVAARRHPPRSNPPHELVAEARMAQQDEFPTERPGEVSPEDDLAGLLWSAGRARLRRFVTLPRETSQAADASRQFSETTVPSKSPPELDPPVDVYAS